MVFKDSTKMRRPHSGKRVNFALLTLTVDQARRHAPGARGGAGAISTDHARYTYRSRQLGATQLRIEIIRLRCAAAAITHDIL